MNEELEKLKQRLIQLQNEFNNLTETLPKEIWGKTLFNSDIKRSIMHIQDIQSQTISKKGLDTA